MAGEVIEQQLADPRRLLIGGVVADARQGRETVIRLEWIRPRAARQWLLLIGRVTGSEYAKEDTYPDHPGEVFPREPWFVRRDAAAYGIALDAHGKIAWGRADIGGDPIVAVLTEQVSDAHPAGLPRDGVSYIFAGERELDLALALDILNGELGIERLLLEAAANRTARFCGPAWSTRSASRSARR
jgi:hypothetical protein